MKRGSSSRRQCKWCLPPPRRSHVFTSIAGERSYPKRWPMGLRSPKNCLQLYKFLVGRRLLGGAFQRCPGLWKPRSIIKRSQHGTGSTPGSLLPRTRLYGGAGLSLNLCDCSPGVVRLHRAVGARATPENAGQWYGSGLGARLVKGSNLCIPW